MGKKGPTQKTPRPQPPGSRKLAGLWVTRPRLKKLPETGFRILSFYKVTLPVKTGFGIFSKSPALQGFP